MLISNQGTDKLKMGTKQYFQKSNNKKINHKNHSILKTSVSKESRAVEEFEFTN